jgi:hypothetical protein
MDFDGARRAVQQHLNGLYADAREHPTVLPYGFDTGQAWAPLVDWDGVTGVYLYLADKSSGGLKPYSFPEFEDMPAEPVGDWPVENTSRLRLAHARTREILNHPGHPNQKIHGRGGVRDALKKAKTDDEVSDAAEAEAKRITGRDIKFDFAGSDVQIAKEHAEGVLRGLERYPDAPLERVYQGGNVTAETRGWMAATDTNTGTITFTDHAQRGGPDIYRDTVAEFQASGHSTIGTPMGIAMHEFGHVVAAHGHATGQVAARTTRLARAAGQSEADYLSQHVSSYATEDYHEAAAEAFADVMHNGVSGASPASVEIATAVDAAYLAAGGTIRQ